MWFLSIALFLVPVKGQEMCKTIPDTFCKTPQLSPELIPSQDRELETHCKAAKINVDCLNSYDSVCTGRSTFTALKKPLNYTRMKIFLDETCDNTKVHRDLILNLPCIKERANLRNRICSKSRENILSDYFKYRYSHRFADHSTDGRYRRECLHGVYTIGCVLQDIKYTCGYSAYVYGMNLFKTNILVDWCDLEMFPELFNFVNDIYIEEELKNTLKNLFTIY